MSIRRLQHLRFRFRSGRLFISQEAKVVNSATVPKIFFARMFRSFVGGFQPLLKPFSLKELCFFFIFYITMTEFGNFHILKLIPVCFLFVFVFLQYNKHLFVHIGQTNHSYSDALLESVDIRQIYDKFPEKKGGLKELYSKGPQNSFFLIKFWVSTIDLRNPWSPHQRVLNVQRCCTSPCRFVFGEQT